MKRYFDISILIAYNSGVRTCIVFIQYLNNFENLIVMTVRFRTIPINTELRAFDDAVDVYMIDPRGFVVRRWLSRQV